MKASVCVGGVLQAAQRYILDNELQRTFHLRDESGVQKMACSVVLHRGRITARRAMRL